MNKVNINHMFEYSENELSRESPSIFFQGLLLLFLVFYFVRFFYPMTAFEVLINVGTLVVFLLAYFIGFNVKGFALTAALTMTFLAFAIAPFNTGASSFIIYSSCFIGWCTSPKQALVFISLNILVVILATILFSLPLLQYTVPGTVFSVVCALFSIFEAQRHRYFVQQKNDQDEIKRLAVIAERERIGRDIHDLLGHTISLIHVKSQLALKQSNSDIALAKQEITDIVNISREALKEVRQAVSGYRGQRLKEELHAQQNYLANVGIELHYQLAAEFSKVQLSPHLEGELSLVVREALTNVLRHAKASQCQIQLKQAEGDLQLIISDNGRGFSPAMINDGQGLASMEKRLNNFGGTLNISSSTSGTSLVATLPWKQFNAISD